MRRRALLSFLTLLFCLSLPFAAQAGAQHAPLLASLGEQEQNEVQQPGEQQEALPAYLDKDLVREHELFTSFARNQVERMNANILGGRQQMMIHRGSDGLYHASYRAIDLPGVVCQVRRSSNNPQYYVGNLIYKEQVLESVGKSPEACRKGHFEPVSEKASRLIYTSKRGGGWN
ncbi:MAG: hypothetical protein P4L39_03100 [Humidesulfovibrio sp.]|nr:hypothetical protein [Humidesulfovibrio sp.]